MEHHKIKTKKRRKKCEGSAMPFKIHNKKKCVPIYKKKNENMYG